MTDKRWVALVVFLLMLVVAPAGAAAVRYARNAGKVDGFSAVEAGTAKRAGKMVATNRRGHLPNDIIVKARDSARLDTLTPTDFVMKCDAGSNFGWARVTPDVEADWEDVFGVGITMAGFLHKYGAPDPCEENAVAARRMSEGVYRVQVTHISPLLACDAGESPPPSLPATITVNDPRPLVATYTTVCDEERGEVQEVSIRDLKGQPADAAFVIQLLYSRLNV